MCCRRGWPASSTSWLSCLSSPQIIDTLQGMPMWSPKSCCGHRRCHSLSQPPLLQSHVNTAIQPEPAKELRQLSHLWCPWISPLWLLLRQPARTLLQCEVCHLSRLCSAPLAAASYLGTSPPVFSAHSCPSLSAKRHHSTASWSTGDLPPGPCRLRLASHEDGD